MILIIGGYSQGKINIAKDMTNANNDDVTNAENCSIENIFDKKIIYNLHILIKRLLKLDIEPIGYFVEKINCLEDKIIICDEIGLGVVPIDKDERNWREVTGRVCCILAKEADEVYRVYAGIATKIKG